MSDEKLNLIISKLEQMDKRFDRNEEMISTLIQMVGNTNAKVDELAADVKEIKNDVSELRHKVEYSVKENSIVKMELDYIKRKQFD